MLQALLDGELDAANAAAAEAHLKTCAGCAAHYRTLQALRVRLADMDPGPPAPARLRAGIEAMIAAEGRRAQPASSRPRRMWSGLAAGWATAGAMAAVAASLFAVQLTAPIDDLQAQLVSSHVRSLQADHLIDVVTSDRHVVKPWFNGRIDFAPPVPDLAAQGFPLAGGRLDYAGGRTVAAVVYRRRAHVINLFVMPSRAAGIVSPFQPRTPGYSVIRWSRGGLDFWAVSDVEAGDLKAFREAFVAHATG
jgi:anti-sigma factor RsiW